MAINVQKIVEITQRNIAPARVVRAIVVDNSVMMTVVRAAEVKPGSITSVADALREALYVRGVWARGTTIGVEF